MSNGAASLRLVSPEPPLAQPAAPASEIEHRIGETVAAAARALCAAIINQHREGQLDPEIKDVFAGRSTAVALLQLDYEFGDDDFMAKARSAGSARLREYLADADPTNADVAISLAIDGLLEIVTNVVKDERIFRRAWAN